jgi:hypothetical protein
MALTAGEVVNRIKICRGSAPDPGSVARGGPVPRSAPSRARLARRRYAAALTSSRGTA